jgi:putative serine protease PepD
MPPKPPPRFRRGTVAIVAAATLAAGALGGTVGALVGGAHDSGGTPAASASTSAKSVSSSTPTDLTSVVAKVLPSVVQVNVRAGNQQGIGSGVILSQDGKILTNNHVVSGADQLTVTLSDGRTVAASVVRTDPTNDLALIQANGVSGLTAAALGDSGSVKVGDQVIAIGSPGGLQGTVTTGIVSALNREVTVSGEQQRQSPIPFSRNGNSTVTYHAIQTDASINQGNSGGPLFNSAGEVIGINSAIYSPVSSPDGAAGSVGIGFSIPINSAKEVIG